MRLVHGLRDAAREPVRRTSMRRSFVAPVVGFILTLGILSARAERAEAQPGWLLGLSGEGGALVGDAEGALGGIAVRVGAQLGTFSIYAQSHGLLGRVTAGPESGSLQGLLWNTAMLGLTFGVFHVAAGPSVDFGWGCEGQGCYRGSMLFGLDGRFALHFDHLVISADVHPTWVRGEPIVGVVGGLGWQL
jgi:hypothetical protein